MHDALDFWGFVCFFVDATGGGWYKVNKSVFFMKGIDMSNFHYVVNETREQAYERKMNLQKEKARLVRLIYDPEIQKVALSFIKQNRQPVDLEALKLAPFFGKSYWYWQEKICIGTFLIFFLWMVLFFVGSGGSNALRETCLFFMAVGAGALSFFFFSFIYMIAHASSKELAICLIVAEHFKQTQPKNSP